MAREPLETRVDMLERRVEVLERLPERMTALESQIVRLREEMRSEFSANAPSCGRRCASCLPRASATRESFTRTSSPGSLLFENAESAARDRVCKASHSDRSATSGSTRAARRIGTRHAITATTRMEIAINTSMTPSSIRTLPAT